MPGSGVGAAVRTAVRERKYAVAVSYEVRVWVGPWAGGWASVGYWSEEDVARMIARAVRTRLEAGAGGPLTPLAVWRVASSGMGFGGEIGERLRGLLPKWVVRADGGFQHTVTKRCQTYRTAEDAHRAALLLWWPREYRRCAEKMVLKLLAEPPSFDDVARRMNGIGMRTAKGELWDAEGVRRLMRRRGRGGRKKRAESPGQEPAPAA